MSRAHARLFVLAVTGSFPLVAASPQTPPPRVQYPPTRSVEHIDTYGTAKVADPYRWLEAIDSTSVADWVRAENAVTMPYLAALPGRDILKQRITALYDFPRSSLPFWEERFVWGQTPISSICPEGSDASDPRRPAPQTKGERI